MSRDLEPDDSPNPQRLGPVRPGAPGRENSGSKRPSTPRGGADSEPSTFRPNPASGGSSGRGGPSRNVSSRKSGSDADDRSSPIVEDRPGLWERIFFGNVSSGQLAQFCRQFSGYLHSGVDLLKTLTSLERQFARTALGPALSRIKMKIRAGSTLEEAMRADERIFGPLFLSMIKVAEARGGLPETLKMLARHFEARQNLIRQARSAMIYPIAVLVIASAVVALITIVLLPMFASLLADISRKATLPLPSRMLMAFSSFIQTMGWWLIPAIMIATPIVLYRFYRTEAGKSLLDRVLLRIPVFGSLALKIDTTRFARTLSTLLDAGVDFGSSMDLTADVVMLRPIRDALLDARPQVMAGKELHLALEESRRFNQDVIAVISSGEETGSLPESLTHLADDYEEQVSLMVKNLGQLIQPFLIVFLGGIVLFIILAVLMPYIQLLTSLSG
jgi:type II secretory pathway component PulF